MADRSPFHPDSEPPEWLRVEFYVLGTPCYEDVSDNEGPFTSYAEAEARGIALLANNNWSRFQVNKEFARRG